jgi:hypothetical protein
MQQDLRLQSSIAVSHLRSFRNIQMWKPFSEASTYSQSLTYSGFSKLAEAREFAIRYFDGCYQNSFCAKEQVHRGTVKQANPLCNGPGVDLLPHPWRPPSVLRRGLLICGSVLGTLQSPHVGLPTSKFSPGFLSRTCMEGENRLSDMISKDAGRAWSWSGG